MAFFKFRQRSDDASVQATSTESVQTLRRRAKYRLLGAGVLVTLGVIGFPLLFDSQPRPIAVDTPIEIPDKNTVLPLSIPAAGVQDNEKVEPATAKVAQTGVVQDAASKPVAAPISEENKAPALASAASSAAHSVVAPSLKPALAPKPTPVVDEAAKAQALLEGKGPVAAKPAASPTLHDPSEKGRFVVQVGAFADGVKAHEVRVKLERAGLKTYTNITQTKDGDRIRVRVGPLGTRGEADRVAQKIKALNLTAAVLTL